MLTASTTESRICSLFWPLFETFLPRRGDTQFCVWSTLAMTTGPCANVVFPGLLVTPAARSCVDVSVKLATVPPFD